MKKRPLTGTITALVTPFRKQAVAYDDLAKLVEAQIKGGIDGIVPVGTTGESPTLSHDEHLEVVRATIAAAAATRGSALVRGRGPSVGRGRTAGRASRVARELEDHVHDLGLLGTGGGLAAEGGRNGREFFAALALELRGVNAHYWDSVRHQRGRKPQRCVVDRHCLRQHPGRTRDSEGFGPRQERH
jgi:hypothetical protein